MVDPKSPKEPRLDQLTKFFTSTAGFIVALTAVIAAVIGLVALVGPKPTASPLPVPSERVTAAPPPATADERGPSLEAWAARADDLCTAAADELSAAVAVFDEDRAAAFDASADALFKLVNLVRDEPTPQAEAASIERLNGLWEEAATALRDGATAYRQGDGPAVEAAATRYDRAVDRATETARGLTATRCAALGTG